MPCHGFTCVNSFNLLNSCINWRCLNSTLYQLLSRETKPTKDLSLSLHLYICMVHQIMGFENSSDLPSASEKNKKASGIDSLFMQRPKSRSFNGVKSLSECRRRLMFWLNSQNKFSLLCLFVLFRPSMDWMRSIYSRTSICFTQRYQF